MSNQNYHFFAASVLNWSTNESLEKCLKMQRLNDNRKNGLYQATSCNVYKVPLPADAHYHIDEYKPEVEGTEFLTKVEY